MPDYQYYQEVFCGDLIPQKKFRNRIARALDWLEGTERLFSVYPFGPESRKLALCALAEVIHRWERANAYEEVTMGGVSVRYEKDRTPLHRQLYLCASDYMDICRGVG